MISVYEALLRIESRQFLREMNATLDYSYLDTPRSGAPIRCLTPRALLHVTCIQWCPVKLNQL